MCTVWPSQWICIKFCIKLEHSSVETNGMIQKATAAGNWWLAASSQQYICLFVMSCAQFSKTSITQVTQPPYSPDLAPCNFWLFPKLKPPLFFFRFYLFIFRERGRREGEREGKKHQSVPSHPQLGPWPTTQACTLTGTQTYNLLFHRPAALSPLSHTSQGLKSPLKGKRFQIIDEIQENTIGQLMAIGKTVWGPKVSTLRGTEASLSYVQCFLYLVTSINVSIFHIYMAGYFLDRPHIVYICLNLCFSNNF